ncbi:Rne/Rng family ribonuclease [Antarcticimicrobium sediminis]|uniref:Ribonuclease E n=1 Tax=Antarcticimicrobium sediminis TaxID=2546227 RepID=A0A4V2Z742_9RHOB|nr:ribonuclease E/G [Antarcticimicrobium sediminis]TDE35076.1 ribonuclease E/G [Antarcticimicrobium sediminis]
MAKKMLIDATHAEETRVVVVDGNKVEEFDFESENKRQLAGNIYLAKVTRVEPSLQAAFVDYGGNRHGFLAFSEIHPDYYQIPVADREALMAEEQAYADAMHAKDEEDEKKPSSRKSSSRSKSRSRTKAEDLKSGDAVETKEVDTEISGMETIDLSEPDEADTADVPEGSSPMERVAETPVEEPQDSASEGDDADESDDGESNRVDDRNDAAAKDSSIESVADDDDHEDIRPPRKPRPRRYKIQEVVKVRQIMLVQVVKEERGNKGAALTTYLSLAGRYCVLMPNTARGGGISRKITNVTDRKKLKEIAAEIDVPKGAGLIVRTAGAKRTKAEIKRDYEYLQRLWEQIRELTLKSIAPAKIYEEGDLIKRSIRDLYNREIDEVLVEGEGGYRIAKDFMKMIMPSHAKNVQHYVDTMPLFARFQVESYLAGMFNPVVQLRSGGYIVIGVTEALVAIDVNSGRATKEGSIEETATKTNLEAAEEVARQLRLRDLAGLIVIDFIDMDERKNNAAVEKRMKDRLKTDRARIQVGRISGFGLMEMSRQRLRPGMIEATTQPCPACHGTGLIRSDDNMALNILRQIEEEGVRRRSREVLVRCPISIVNYLMNQKREHILQIETRYGLSVRVEGDAHLISPDFTLEKFKTATRAVPEAVAPVVSVDASLMAPEEVDEDEIEDEVEDEIAAEVPDVVAEAETETDEETPKPKRKRRRRRRKPKSGSTNGNGETGSEDDDASVETPVEAAAATEADAKPADAEDGAVAAEPKPKPKSSRSRSRSRSRKPVTETVPEVATEATSVAAEVEATPEAAPEVKPVDVVVAEPVAAPEPVSEVPEPVAEVSAPVAVVQPEPAPVAEPEPVAAPEPEVVSAPEPAPVSSPAPVAAEAEPALAEDKPKSKRRGWWALGS